CITATSSYKAIDLLIKYINISYTLDFKYNKNSTHDILSTFKRLALNNNYIAIIRKAIESFLRTKQKGIYIHRQAAYYIIEYAYKLYNNGVIRPRYHEGPILNIPDIYKLS
ncbi:hypothetical protein SODALDRAFT_281282, partial [Sodiomyces alkalinus F11]